jgi:methionyl-tRNA formyltransferase
MTLRLAIFGQAPFGRDVAVRLADAGHRVVAAYVPPDRERPDPLAEEAAKRGWPLFRHRHFRRRGGETIGERVAEYLALGAELNVMPFTTVILPREIVDAPEHRSLCFHPSLLPAYRGGSAIAQQIILGARETGVTVFQPDAGVDTGPIVVQRGGVRIEATDTAGSLYFDKLYALGVEAMVEAVGRVADGSATFTPQPAAGASFQPLVDDEVARIDWTRPVDELDRLIRGCDPSPGAWARLGERRVRLFGGARVGGAAGAPPGTLLGFEAGRAVFAAAGGRVAAAKLRVGDGKKVPAPEAGLAPGDRLD